MDANPMGARDGGLGDYLCWVASYVCTFSAAVLLLGLVVA